MSLLTASKIFYGGAGFLFICMGISCLLLSIAQYQRNKLRMILTKKDHDISEEKKEFFTRGH